MFEIVPGRENLAGTGAQVITAYRGGNAVQLAVPGHPPQPVSAEVVAVRIGAQTGVLIHLWLKAEHCGVLFRPSVAVSDANYRDVLQQAVQYAETMGFLMDADASHVADLQRLAILGYSAAVSTELAPRAGREDAAAMSVAQFVDEPESELVAAQSAPAANSFVREQWQVWVKYLASF